MSMPKEDRPIRTLGEWRKRLPMSQAELAEALGVKLTTLRTWEQYTNHPRPATHRKLAAYLGVEPWQISFDKPHADLPKAEAAA